ncbi:MAG: DNA polymerase III subunit gamma/tau [Lachnospiraceae bacterium]|nr:DNA polymerase III subunit gamma/tau [Lachnospiraceae bacterium]
MSYTALYRKYRPDSFADVRGQEAPVRALRNQIRGERIGHAYLFCGTRGTGKTSVAKIFAKAVNCEAPVDGEACGQCASCRAIASGVSMNVVEIDAASNNGVESIRQIRDEVAYSPSEGKYRVYIIDEVHMLSTAAFNALLKTLEEPPSYVIFILATTEAHKIPVTILSRCQRYDFFRLSLDQITGRLTEVLEKEGIQADEKAIRYLARKADGGMRDALSLTDQCLSFYMGQELTYEKVLDILGAVDVETYSQLFRHILTGDVAGVFTTLDDLIRKGVDLQVLTGDMSTYLRNLLLIRSTAQAEDLLDVSAENLQRMQEDAKASPDAALLRYIRVFSELANQMRWAVNKRIILEVALIKLCRPEMETDVDSLAERIRMLEQKLESGQITVSAGAAAAGGARMNAAAPAVHAAPVPPRPVYERAVPEDFQLIRQQWNGIVENMDGHPLLREALKRVELKFNAGDEEDNCIYLIVDDFLGKNEADKPDTIQYIEEQIAQQIDKHVRVRMLTMEQQRPVTGLKRIDQIDRRVENMIHMPIEFET